MSFKYTLEIFTLIVIVAFCALFLYTSSSMDRAEFSGSDSAGSELVSILTGNAVENFKPLIPQWQPPNPEIESCMFAFQAAIGGIVVGGVFGYWIGQKKKA